jgi:hypothetical protein
MNLDLDLGIDPPGPFHDISELHRLEVGEDPEDGFTILHPNACEVEIHEYGGFTWTDHQCMVSWHVDGCGVDDTYRHAFDEPDLPGWQHREPLLPGIYTCWVEVVKYRCWDAWGGYEYDSVLHVEPQAAIDVGPSWGKVYWTKLNKDGRPTSERHYLGWGKLL